MLLDVREGVLRVSCMVWAQITQADFPLTEDYTAPKGSLLMPSLIAASMQVQPLAPFVVPFWRN